MNAPRFDDTVSAVPPAYFHRANLWLRKDAHKHLVIPTGWDLTDPSCGTPGATLRRNYNVIARLARIQAFENHVCSAYITAVSPTDVNRIDPWISEEGGNFWGQHDFLNDGTPGDVSLSLPGI